MMQVPKPVAIHKSVQIPNDWKVETIEDCCNILDSKRIPLNSEERKKMAGDIPYYGANGVQGYINKYIFDQDLILLAEDGGYFSDYQTRPIAYYVQGRSWVNNHAHVLTNKQGYELKWIFYSLVHKNIQPWIKGSTRVKLNQNELRKIVIPIPPVSEQRKIACILSKVDELIQKTDQIIEQIPRLKKGLMQRLLTKGIGHTKFKNIKLAFGEEIKVPEEWYIVSLDDLCSNITDGKHGDCQNEIGSGYYFISAKDILDGEIHYENARQITKQDFLDANKRTKLEPGDILLTNSGTIGKLAIVKNNPLTNKTTFQKSVAILKPVKDKVTVEYLYYCLLQNQKRLENISAGSSQRNLLLLTLRLFNIAIPNTPQEQKNIGRILSFVDTQIQNENTYRTNLIQLKNGLMRKLLTGKVRVKV